MNLNQQPLVTQQIPSMVAYAPAKPAKKEYQPRHAAPISSAPDRADAADPWEITDPGAHAAENVFATPTKYTEYYQYTDADADRMIWDAMRHYRKH